MAPIAKFMRRKKDSAVKDKKWSNAFETKDLTDTMEMYSDINKCLPRCSNCKEDGPSRTKSPKLYSKDRTSKREMEDAKRHTSSWILSNDEFDPVQSWT